MRQRTSQGGLFSLFQHVPRSELFTENAGINLEFLRDPEALGHLSLPFPSHEVVKGPGVYINGLGNRPSAATAFLELSIEPLFLSLHERLISPRCDFVNTPRAA